MPRQDSASGIFTFAAFKSLEIDSLGSSYGTLFSEYTYSDISIDIILQINKEESCFLSVSICNPPFSVLRISEKLASENFSF